ncbi:MAG: chondroitinase-B domain-containing protein [Pseudomonadota bacterium]
MRQYAYPFTAVGVVLAIVTGSPALAATVDVHDPTELISAIAGAQAGDVITLAAGTYAIGHNLSCTAAGQTGAPIVVKAAQLGNAIIEFDAVEGFKVSGPHWTFENLDIRGACADHNNCEHAFHVVGAADFTILRGNRVRDFNAQVKGNAEDPGGGRIWPDDVLIEGNEFFNTTVRQTSNPVTPIDVVGGRRWVIRANHIHDHAKGQGDNVSYAAFLKGNSRDGLFERNLVECEKLHTGQVRLGLSFGGGGSSPDPICEDGNCSIEHQNGIMRNNVIANCPADVGIYVNEGVNVQILHNTLINTAGIDVRFAVSTADLRYNVLNGQIRGRDSATLSQTGNLTGASLGSIFTAPGSLDLSLVDGSSIVNQGTTLAAVPDDFCANLRGDGQPDLGAVEYDGDGPCDATQVHAGSTAGTDAGSAQDAALADTTTTHQDASIATDGAPGQDSLAPVDAGARSDTSSATDLAVVEVDAQAADSQTGHDASAVRTGAGCACSAETRLSDSSWVLVAGSLVTLLAGRRRIRTG